VILPTQFAGVCARGWSADSNSARLRQKTELLRLTGEQLLHIQLPEDRSSVIIHAANSVEIAEYAPSWHVLRANDAL